jgi:hypothetical protein
LGGLLILATAPARAEVHTTVSLTGLYVPGSLSFSESRTFTEFAEAGRIDASYGADPAPGFEGAARVLLGRRLGLMVALAYLKRTESASFNAALPHPLYFDRPRRVSGTTDALSYRETASHLDLVFIPTSSPRLEAVVFAGVSLSRVRVDLIDHIQYTQTYPYDTVTAVSGPAAAFQDNPVGFNLGAGLDARLGRHFGLGAQGRFSRLKAHLTPSAGNSVGLDAGGFQVGAGIRLFF